MPDPRKATTTRLPLTGATATKTLTPMRPGMPALDSIQKTLTFAPRAGGPTYHIMRTTETDAYEQTPAALDLSKLLRTKGAPPTCSARESGQETAVHRRQLRGNRPKGSQTVQGARSDESI